MVSERLVPSCSYLHEDVNVQPYHLNPMISAYIHLDTENVYNEYINKAFPRHTYYLCFCFDSVRLFYFIFLFWLLLLLLFRFAASPMGSCN